MDFTKPAVGHDCPNTIVLHDLADDECDLPEVFRRFSYSMNLDSQHDCHSGVFSHMPRFCRVAIWREVKYEMRKKGETDGQRV